MDDDWDTEVALDQDQFNQASFASDGKVSAVELEKEQMMEEKELKIAKATNTKAAPVVDTYGFTAQRNARKASEAKGGVRGNVKKTVPLVPALDEPIYDSVQTKASGSSAVKKIVDPELATFFAESEDKKFAEQAVDFLNAYWSEVGDQAEFIFSAAHRWFVEADMHTKGVTLRHMYEEGKAVDYNVAAYFYEKLHSWLKKTKEGKVFANDPTYAPSMLTMKTAIQLKKDFREKVDVNFDGQISFLEHLLYQYNNVANPEDFMARRQAMDDEHEVIRKARLALDDINAQIKKYEARRQELEEGAAKPGVKGLSFKHQLSMLDASPLAEALQKSLITAEAAVRIAVKHFKGKRGGGGAKSIPEGSLWWMKRELKAKKEVVVPATLRRVKNR